MNNNEVVIKTEKLEKSFSIGGKKRLFKGDGG